MSDQQERSRKARVANGEYASDSEHLRDLVGCDLERSGGFRALQEAIQEGLASGVSDRTVNEIWAEAEQRYGTRLG